jgi:hypothetical protein
MKIIESYTIRGFGGLSKRSIILLDFVFNAMDLGLAFVSGLYTAINLVYLRDVHLLYHLLYFIILAGILTLYNMIKVKVFFPRKKKKKYWNRVADQTTEIFLLSAMMAVLSACLIEGSIGAGLLIRP